jgi:hypothetical protein
MNCEAVHAHRLFRTHNLNTDHVCMASFGHEFRPKQRTTVESKMRLGWAWAWVELESSDSIGSLRYRNSVQSVLVKVLTCEMGRGWQKWVY